VDEVTRQMTKDVDNLGRPANRPTLIAMKTAAGFHHRNTSGIDMLVEDPAGTNLFPEPLREHLPSPLHDPDD